MSSLNIFDASAVLAYLQDERGSDIVEAVLEEGAASISTVNTCEVLGKLVEKGVPLEEAQAAIDELGLTIVDFDQEQARQAASLRVLTKSIGSSLGDRACLALAMRMSSTGDSTSVYTAEQGWGKLKWAFKMVVIRNTKGAS